jgi:hypothetical protein
MYLGVSENVSGVNDGKNLTSWELRGKNFFFRGKNLELLVMVFNKLQKYLGTSWE